MNIWGRIIGKIGIAIPLIVAIFLFGSLGISEEAQALCFKVNGKEQCLDKSAKVSGASQRSYANPRYLCSGGDRCLVIYIAPWCSVCKVQTPNYNQILAKTRGISSLKAVVVIGEERRKGNNRKAAKDFPQNGVKIDQDLSIHKQLKIRAYPHYSLESTTETLQSGKESYNSILNELDIPPIEKEAFGAIRR